MPLGGGGASRGETLYVEARDGRQARRSGDLVRRRAVGVRDEEVRDGRGGGILAGILVATQVAGPLFAQEAEEPSVYEQLDLFGIVFERIRNANMSRMSTRAS